MSERCSVCGLPIEVGDYPCVVRARPHQRGINGAIGDECDFVQENGTRHPIRFRSKAAFRNWLDSTNQENRVRHVTIPGTDKSPYTTDWSRGSVDLVAATAAVSEPRGKIRAPDTSESDVPITWTVRDWEPA